MIPASLLIFAYKVTGYIVYFILVVSSIISVDFKDQITLGSIIVAALILVAAGLITIRSNVARIWREDAEGQRVAKERKQEELDQLKESHVEYERQQTEIRHELKGEKAALIAQLKVMEAKTDLSEALRAIHELSIAQTENSHHIQKLLEEIRDKLPATPTEVKIVEGET